MPRIRIENVRQLVSPHLFGSPTIGMALFGCANRPFYQICVFPDKSLGRRSIQGKGPGAILEQLGTYDPLPNKRNEKLVTLNIQRIKYWMGERNVQVSVPVLELLGLAGLLPIHPKTCIRAIEGRERLEERDKALAAKREQQLQQAEAAANSSSENTTDTEMKAGEGAS